MPEGRPVNSQLQTCTKLHKTCSATFKKLLTFSVPFFQICLAPLQSLTVPFSSLLFLLFFSLTFPSLPVILTLELTTQPYPTEFDCISYKLLNKPSKGNPEITPEDLMKHKLVFIRTLGFFNPVCFPYKAESCNLPCSHVYANTRQYICLFLHRLVLVGLWGYQMELTVHKW